MSNSPSDGSGFEAWALRGPYEIIEPPEPEGSEERPTYWSFRWEDDVWQDDLVQILRTHQTESVKRIKIQDAYMFRSLLHDALRTAIEEELGLRRWKFCLRPQQAMYNERTYSLVVESFKIIALHDDSLPESDWSEYVDHQPEERLVEQGPDSEQSNVYVQVDLADIIPEKRVAIKKRLIEVVEEKWRDVESVEFSKEEHSAKFKIRRSEA